MDHLQLTRCDNHPAQGGSHVSRALIVGRYLDHDATVVMCTARVGKVTRENRRHCGNEYLVFGSPGRHSAPQIKPDPWLVVYNYVTYGPRPAPQRVIDALEQLKEERS